MHGTDCNLECVHLHKLTSGDCFLSYVISSYKFHVANHHYVKIASIFFFRTHFPLAINPVWLREMAFVIKRVLELVLWIG